ncbi:hypothetical protein [Streptomyces sp. B5E4]|uniref:HNH endonuclease n=1 Tax=Streptomyces sp. B5E4 TaxID=3153568 RepID=UPI00325DD98F
MGPGDAHQPRRAPPPRTAATRSRWRSARSSGPPGTPGPAPRTTRRPPNPPSDWARVMLQRRRKTVVACDVCHDRIHSERPARPLTQ